MGRLLGWVASLLLLGGLTLTPEARAQTYQSASTTFNWIDTASHTRIGYNTTPYKFNGGGSTGCGSTPPVLDDTISDLIPLGFTFTFGTTNYTQVRIQTNGRLQFNNAECGYGTASVGPPQTYPYGYPVATMNNTMKVFGVDLDPTNKIDSASYPTTCNGHANCYVKWASIGIAPNRQFVVTWFHVPEWVSASNTSGSFDLQVILNEDGSFVYQYGAITHGGTGSAQIGWQLTTTDYAVLTFGASTEPPPNTAIVFFKPSALANYRFEEGAWASGGANQVIDSSTGARHGMALGLAQTITGGYVCRGAQIPANSTGATVDAVQTGVNLGTVGLNLLGTGTVSFWYKSNVAWSGAGAQSAQLLDATTVNGQWFFLTKKSSGTLHFGVTDSTGTLRAVETPVQSFAANTWVHVAVSWNFNALAAANSDQLKIHVNGAAPTISAFTSNGTITAQAGLLHVGDNALGSAAANGSVNSANGVIDEVNIYNSALSTAQVGADMVATHACPTFNIHHLEIQSSGSGLTCAASPITIRACRNAACSLTYTSGISGTLAATGVPVVNWDGSSGGAPGNGFAIPAGASTTTKNIQMTSAGSVVLSITSADPAVPNPTTCNFGSPACTFIGSTAGFLVTSASTATAAATIPPQVSGTPSGTFYLRALQAVTNNPAVCTPALISQANVPVTFGYTCTDPATCQAGNLLTINATAVPSGGGSVNLNFDANASAPFTVRYDDVGQITLNASKTFTPFGGATPVSFSTGSSFIAAPAGFSVLPSGPYVAGSPFAVAVTAVNSLGGTTQNFGKESSTENVTLGRVLVAPLGGNNPVLTGTTTLADAGFQAGNGVASTNAVAWGEVGDIAVTATLASGSYLGSGLTASGSGAAGPFRPAYFDTAVTPGAGSITYSSQPFGVTVTARNAAGTTTQNYQGTYAKAVTLADANSATNNSATLGTLANTAIAAASFSNGVATVNTPAYGFLTKLTAPLETPSSAPLKLRATDTDGVTSNGHAEGTTPIRAGRLRLVNYHGSELLRPRVEYRAEYWDGNRWATNTLDTGASATAIVAGNVAKPALLGVNSITPLTAGIGFVTFNIAAAGSYDIALDLNASGPDKSCNAAHGGTAANMPWLQGHWSAPANCGGVAAWAQDPNARVRLGSPRAPYIYLRERY
jgi:MSHA biogenesis protein MshQ